MESKILFACCAAAASAVLLCGIAPAQDEPVSPPNDVADKTVRVGNEAPRRSIMESVRGFVRDWRQRTGGNSQMEQNDLPDEPQEITPPPPPQSEAPFLKELAEWLSVPIPENATPGDIAFAIRHALSDNTTRYSGEVLSTEAFKECRAAIPTTKDRTIFDAYHKFIKKVAGKRILVLDCDNPESNN